MMSELESELAVLKKSSLRAGVHPYSKLNLHDFIYKVSGIPIKGYHTELATRNPNDCPYGLVHNRMIDKLENGEVKRLLFIIARGHGKSTVVSEYYPAWEILRNPSIRIIIVSESKDLATASINNASGYLEDLGVVFTKNDEELKFVARPKMGVRKRDPTLMSASTDSKLHGRHCDILILDDTVVLENMYTQKQREKFEEWFSAKMSQVLEPNGRLIVTGVRWRQSDFHGVLADKVRHPEFVDGTIIARACNEDFTDVLWSEKWSEELLRRKLAEIGPIFWKSQYMLDPSAMEGGTYKLDWIFGEGSSEYESAKLPHFEYKSLGVDPALGLGLDMFAACILGMTDGNEAYVLGFLHENLPTGQQGYRVIELVKEYGISKVGVEKVGYQVALKNAIEEKIKDEGLHVNVEGFEGPKKKEIRLAELGKPFLNGEIRFPKEAKPWKMAFQTEYASFPTGENSYDMLDALYYAWKTCAGPMIKFEDNWEPSIMSGSIKEEVKPHPVPVGSLRRW
jgi:predicted phage terminase large subunit-like protein